MTIFKINLTFFEKSGIKMKSFISISISYGKKYALPYSICRRFRH